MKLFNILLTLMAALTVGLLLIISITNSITNQSQICHYANNEDIHCFRYVGTFYGASRVEVDCSSNNIDTKINYCEAG